MDLQMVREGLEFARKRKKWVIILAALGVSGYGVYRVYNLPTSVKKRKRFFKLFSALISIVEVVSDSTETVGIVSRDLREFLQSDSDEIPNSLKQISKITRSNEFSGSVERVTEALTKGVLRGYKMASSSGGKMKENSGFYDRFVDKLFSNAGSGFASVVVGSFARNLVMGFYIDEKSNLGSDLGTSGGDEAPLPWWVNAMCDDRCKEIIGDWIQLLVSTAVDVYLEKTMNINTYDEFFSGLANPKHEKNVRDMLVSVCNSAIDTLVRTSHQVLTSSSSNRTRVADTTNVSHLTLKNPHSNAMSYSNSYDLAIDLKNPVRIMQNDHNLGTFQGKMDTLKSSDKGKHSSWLSQMSTTLEIPSNRKFVLDVTGRVTFEMVKLFMEFVLEKVLGGLKRGVNIVQEVVVERGLEMVRYVAAKSSVVATICLSLCLHVLDGTWLLIAA